MKLKLLSALALLSLSSAYAEDAHVVTTQVVDMELNKDKDLNPEPATVTVVRPKTADEIAIGEEKIAEFEKAIVMDGEKTEEDEVKKVKVELGAEHSPENYPQFLATVFSLNYSEPRINVEKILDGGVVVDEIPALVNPLILSIKEAEEYLHYTDNEYVAAIEINGDARAYPLRILNWHQGVNDEIGGQPVFIAYDPLSGNVIAIDRRVIGEKETTFGVTGQVYNSASLYYDRGSKSIWSAFENQAVTGPLSGTPMKHYEAVLTTWKSYKETYPEGVVLDAMDTGYERNYRQNPYGDYAKNEQMLFPLDSVGQALAKKEYVVGVRMYKDSRHIEVAIPINTLLDSKKKKIDFSFDEVQVFGSSKIPLSFEIKEPYGTIEVTTTDEQVQLQKFYGFWFVWSAYNPNTRVITTLD